MVLSVCSADLLAGDCEGAGVDLMEGFMDLQEDFNQKFEYYFLRSSSSRDCSCVRIPSSLDTKIKSSNLLFITSALMEERDLYLM